MNPDETTIAIMGQDIPARHELIRIDKLRFLPSNPRVYAAIREMPDFDDLTPDEKQARIYQSLLHEPSVKNLVPEIERDRGLHEPIIVRWDTQEVIEGNSRLAAYRKLYDGSGNDVWTLIRCYVVKRLTDDQQTRLLGQAHLQGKTDWSPYAKALFCYRWVVTEGKAVPALARLSGFSPDAIKKNVRVIELMQENGDNKLTNFSYYDVLVRSRSISSAIKNSKPLRDTVLSQIKSNSFIAQNLRDHLPKIIAKPRILRKYEKGDVTLEEAYQRAKISGAEQRLKKIREGLDEIEQVDLVPLERSELKAVQQVIRQIGQRLKRVSKMVDTKLDEKSANA